MPHASPMHNSQSSGNASGVSESSPAPTADRVSLVRRPQGWLLCLFLYVLAMPVFLRPASMTWHDWQRITQVLLFVFATIYLLLARARLPLPTRSRALLAAITTGGILSALLAPYPLWALTEVALMLSCLGLIWATADVRQRLGPATDQWVVMALLVICGLKVLQFAVSYAIALTTIPVRLDPWRLMEGFSNIRFYGQFITLSLPLLALPLLTRTQPSWRRAAAFGLLGAWWMLAITSGTRGTWLAMLVTVVTMSATGQPGRRWAAWQVSGALCGGLLFWCLFNVLPTLQGAEVSNHPATRLTTSVSLRDSLWLQAAHMIRDNPWLGAGPMHFASLYNGIATHPHNSLLQWLAEWGVIPTLLLAVLLWQAALALGNRLVGPDTRPLYCCLAASLAAALVQSMVDGVIVMPYIQLWLCLVAGLLLAAHQRDTGSTGNTPAWLATSLIALTLLIGVVVRDASTLEEQKRLFLKAHATRLMPRFWNQGLIGSEKSESDAKARMVPQRGIEPPTY